MTDVELTASNIIDHMRSGATLQRHGDLVELDIPDTSSVRVPVSVFEDLVEQKQIEPCGGGFFKLIEERS